MHGSEKFLLLGREVAIPPRFDFALAGKWRHLAQGSRGEQDFGAERNILQFMGAGIYHGIAGLTGGYAVNGNDRTAVTIVVAGGSFAHVVVGLRRRTRAVIVRSGIVIRRLIAFVVGTGV